MKCQINYQSEVLDIAAINVRTQFISYLDLSQTGFRTTEGKLIRCKLNRTADRVEIPFMSYPKSFILFSVYDDSFFRAWLLKTKEGAEDSMLIEEEGVITSKNLHICTNSFRSDNKKALKNFRKMLNLGDNQMSPIFLYLIRDAIDQDGLSLKDTLNPIDQNE